MSIDEERDISELHAELLSSEPAEGDTSFGCIPYEIIFIEFGSVNSITLQKNATGDEINRGKVSWKS